MTRSSVASLSGIAFCVSGYLLATATDTVIKWLSPTYPLAQIIFFNGLFGLMTVLGVAVATGGTGQVRTRRLGLHVLRSAMALAGFFTGYYGLGHMPLADFYALVFTAPLFITALSVPVLGEKVDAARWGAVAVGFLGVSVMASPSGDAGITGVLAVLAGSLFYSGAVLLVRRAGETEKAATFAFWGNLVAMAGSGVLLPGRFIAPPPADLGLFVLGGIGGSLALLCLFAAFRRTPAAVLAPFQYTQMLWGVLVGWILFGEWPSSSMAFGGVLVMGAGLFILWRETRGRLA